MIFRLTIVFTFLFLNTATDGLAQNKTLNNHIDVIEQFSIIKSKSRQIVLMAKKSMANTPELDSVKIRYLNLKTASDATIARYKSIIDNPDLARKSGANITKNLNELVEEMNGLTKFYLENNSMQMGFGQIPGLGIVQLVGGVGLGLYKDIKDVQKNKKISLKTEVDQYEIPDFESVQ